MNPQIPLFIKAKFAQAASHHLMQPHLPETRTVEAGKLHHSHDPHSTHVVGKD